MTCAVCTAPRMPDSREVVLSAYFPHVPLSDGSLIVKLRHSISPLRGPHPLVLPVAFKYDERKLTAADQRTSMDRVPELFMAAEV